MILSAKQSKALDVLEDKTTNELLYGGGAGSAKSILGCYWLHKMALKYPNTRYLMGRAVLKTLKETTLVSFFKTTKLLKLPQVYKYTENKGIFFKNGSVILLKHLDFKPSDPEMDELGSLELTGAFVDEANQITEKVISVLFSRIRHLLDENNLIPKALYTCNPAKNWTYNNFYLPNKNGTLGIKKKFIPALVTDNPFISKHYVESLHQLPKNSRERLLYGNWEYDDDPNTLLSFESIQNIFTNDFVQPGNFRCITADIALEGKDYFVAYAWAGWVVIDYLVIPKADAKQIETALQNFAFKNQIPQTNILVDANGIGSYLKGYIKNSKQFLNNGSPLIAANTRQINYFANLKSQCIYEISIMINENKLYLGNIKSSEVRTAIRRELELWKLVYKNEKIGVIPKDEIKLSLGRSPDYTDALYMRYYFFLTKNQ